MLTRINDALRRRLHDARDGENEKGFTLIELMVVIIIIGILAAIAIPAFLNQRTAAWDASAKSDLANAAIAASTYAQSNNGSYLNLTATALGNNGFTVTTGNVFTIVGTPTAGSYTATEYDPNSAAAPGTGHLFTLNTGTITGPS